MNLFVESLANYLKQEWDHALNAVQGPKEARFILQSLDPESTFSLFAELEEHRQRWGQRHSIECHFRVATGLWRDWQISTDADTLDKAMRRLGGLGPNGERCWIDEDDRLTFYRNRTRAPHLDGLVVVLVGFNHASDQGGQADFHRVDEQRLWQEMGQSFEGWVRRMAAHYAPDASDIEIERFDEVIQQLFHTRSRQLNKLAEFLDQVAGDGKDIVTLGDLLKQFYARLSYWGIPPLLNVPTGKKGVTYLKEADAFINHQRFKTPTEQKKAWKKLAEAFADGRLDVPEEVEPAHGPVFTDTKAYQAVLHDFIHSADGEARKKLLQADLVPVLEVLKRKDNKPPSPPKTLRLSGLSFEVMLQAVWHTLQEFQQKVLGNRPLTEILDGIRIFVVSFNHDLAASPDSDLDSEEVARELLDGCLGGLDKVFEQIDWRLPIDADQAQLPRDAWEKSIPLRLDMTTLKFGTGKAHPHVKLRVELEYCPGEEPLVEDSDDAVIDEEEVSSTRAFRKAVIWAFEPTQPERVRYECAKAVLEQWGCMQPGQLMLPAFRMPTVAMTALYFAADEEEANRLVAQALAEMRVVNLLADLGPQSMAGALRGAVQQVSDGYRSWLKCYVKNGYYAANVGYFQAFSKAYRSVAETVLDTGLLGSAEVLRRLYKSFLLIDEIAQPNDDYLASAVAWGLSPPVMELAEARICFLRDSFPEVVCELALGRGAKSAFEQLLNLAELHRPLAGLVVDSHKRLSAEVKSFGLLHHIGMSPPVEKSLAVQTLLREEAIDDDDDIADSVRPNAESEVVLQVLRDYVRFYPFANDGIRILALNVDELATILSGVDRFLRDYLKNDCSENWPPFHCSVMVYSTSSSPMVTENRLTAWREHLMETCRENGRSLRLSIGHRYARERNRMMELLTQEGRLYDVALLFHFLEGELTGEIKEALPFQFDYNPLNISRFPICEYPRPIQEGNVYKRQSLLSNRRLGIQTRHADLSARLRHPQNSSRNHLIFGHVDFQPWQPVVEGLHQKAQWVACIDPFVDKYMLCGREGDGPRKIVGFASGLGDHGELNLSVSTEQDTLTSLTNVVHGNLSDLLPLQPSNKLGTMASQVVHEAEEIIGLASLHAVVGEGEKIREVVGFAAIRRALAKPAGADMSQLLPIDALLHWFKDNDVVLRPDLLQVSLTLRENELPLVQAVVIECKLGQHNPIHQAKAVDQVCAGLSHLTQLFSPNRADIARMSFDRRYWWAQLQRAMTTRALVNLPEAERNKLDRALEYLAEGYYEITWHGAIFTFWTDDPGPDPDVQGIALPSDTLTRPFHAPEGFAIWHLALGYEGLLDLFAQPKSSPQLTMEDKPAIRIGAEVAPPSSKSPPKEDMQPSSTVTVDIDTTPGHKPPLATPYHEPLPVDLGLAPKTVVTAPSIETSAHAEPAKVDHLRKSGSDTSAGALPGHFEIVTPKADTVPDRLLIGTRANGEPVYWYYGHPRLNNRHLLIFGSSGSGKTYGIQCLLAEMAAQGLHSLIIDYTDGFLPQQTEPLFRDVAKPQDHFVIKDKLPLNPFRRQRQMIDPSIPLLEESPFQVATRIASIFSSVFETMGDQQRSTLIRVLETGIDQASTFNLDDLLPRLREEDSYGETLASKLEPLIKSQPFRESGDESAWEHMLSSPERWVQVLQLKGLARDIQMMVTEFTLWDLYDFACNSGNKNRPIPLVLDEFQNLDRSSGSPIDKMVREGRKFGLSLLLATQTINRFNQDECALLFQAGHKLIFKPADPEIDRFAQLLSQYKGGTKSEWGQHLARLKKGECWSLGPVLTSNGALEEKAVLVSVTALEKRSLNR